MSVLAFGDDRSEGANICWQWIVAHNWDGWKLEVVTAEAPADMRPVSSEEAELHPWEPDEPRDAGGAGFDSVTHLRAEVDARLALISRGWDLVAIGARGAGLLKSLHLGSTADWLLREPTSPLLVARRPDPVARILVAADGSAHAAGAVDTLVSVPWFSGTSVRVVSVDDGHLDAETTAEETREQLSSHGADVETAIRRGNVTRSLMAEIDEWHPDLVVMGVRGHSRMKRLVVGSSTAAVVGATDCSVLVAHAK